MPISKRVWRVEDESDMVQNPRYRVLLVEDDRLDQMAFGRFVETAGLAYDCTIVGSVAETQEVLRSQPFDVVLCDYSLGDGTALDVLSLVKDIPLVLVTGAGSEEIAVKAWRAGAYDYLVKDSNRNYLTALPITVENAVKYQRVRKELELLAGAIMSTEDCIYLTDLHGKIIFVNRAFCRTYGYSRQQILGKDSSILWTGWQPHVHTGSVFTVRTAGGGSVVGYYHERQDGKPLPVSLSRSIIKDFNGHEVAVVGIARDLSEQLLVDNLLTERMANGSRATVTSPS